MASLGHDHQAGKSEAFDGFPVHYRWLEWSKPPAQPPANLTSMAVDTGTVVTELRMVPNQPLTFAGETKGRVRMRSSSTHGTNSYAVAMKNGLRGCR